MKINMNDIPREVYDGNPIEGDVYPIQGGVGSGRRFRIVVGINNDAAYCIIIDRGGEIVGSDRCATHYLERKGRVGFCDLSPLQNLAIDWNV